MLSGAAAKKEKTPNPLAGLPRNLQIIDHNAPGVTTDLGVGLWASPIPYDANGDGFPDLFVVSCGSPEMKDVFYFENTGKTDPKTGAPLFKKGVAVDPAVISKSGLRVSHALTDVTPSYVNENGKETLRVTSPKGEYPDFLKTGLANPQPLPVTVGDVYNSNGRLRGSNWSYVDWNNDGKLDLLVGLGDWTDYGWDNAYDQNGRWRNGPLHGFVFVMLNTGTNENPVYAPAQQVYADNRVIDVYGNPSAQFADFRGNGVRDIITGEFVDGFTYFQNVGTPQEPKFLSGKPLARDGKYLIMPLEMIEVVAYDWNKDGKTDLVVGQEDGRVALMRNEGFTEKVVMDTKTKKPKVGAPKEVSINFSDPQMLRQEADHVKFGVLNTPVCVDWDGDGLVDILTGNAAGELGFIKNLGGKGPLPSFAEVQVLEADGKPIRYIAGPNRSIQGPAEAKWGYTNIGVGDWDGDGLLDILASTIEGKIYFHKNIGTKTQPKLANGVPLTVAWNGPTPKPVWNWWNPQNGELVVHWRCTPVVIDIDGDGINDLVSVDHEGYLAFYRQIEKDGKRVLLPGERIFRMKGQSTFDMKNAAPEDALSVDKDGHLRLNSESAGRSGRRTYCFVDWDGDGKLDLLVNGLNVDFLKNISTKPGEWVFENKGPVDGTRLAGHSTAPGVVDWDGNGVPDLVVGAEDGFFYYLKNPRQPQK